MNNLIKPLSLVICFMALSFSTRAQVWDSVGNCGFSGDYVQFTSLVIDSSGVPIVAYQDWANSDRATVKAYRAGTWLPQGPVGFTSGSAYWTSLAIGPGNLPYLAFEDLDNYSRASVMRFNGLYWEDLGSPGFSEQNVTGVTMAIGKDGTPYVSFKGIGHYISVMKYNGSAWGYVGDSAFTTGDYNSLAVDTAGTPYLAFQTGAGGGKVNVVRFVGGSWVTVGAANFSAAVADYVTIAIDSRNTPYVAYQDWGNLEKATVMKYNGSAWVNVGSPGFSPGMASWTSIAIHDTIPYVGFENGGGTGAYANKACVMKWDGNSWNAVGSSNVSAGAVQYASMAVSPNGVPYIAYQDGARAQKVTVMKYDFPTEVRNVMHASSVILSPNPNRGTFALHISTQQKEEATIIITNMLGEKVRKLSAMTNADTQMQLNAPPGVYFISATTTEGRISEKIVVE